MKSHTLIPAYVPNGECYGSLNSATEITIKDIVGLATEIEALKAENAQLREWLSWGKYSAR
jgi:hypothetical protein